MQGARPSEWELRWGEEATRWGRGRTRGVKRALLREGQQQGKDWFQGGVSGEWV